MDVPKGHTDPRVFLDEVEPLIHEKLVEEFKALKGVKFHLALMVKLRKDKPEEYMEPVLRHTQEAILQKSQIKGALNPQKSKKHLKSGHIEDLAGL